MRGYAKKFVRDLRTKLGLTAARQGYWDRPLMGPGAGRGCNGWSQDPTTPLDSFVLRLILRIKLASLIQRLSPESLPLDGRKNLSNER